MLFALATLLQAEPEGWWPHVVEFLDSPAPYSPFSEYLLVLFVLWLIARLERRRREKKSLDEQAQEVLDEKYAAGEISVEGYHKFRQDVSMRRRH